MRKEFVLFLLIFVSFVSAQFAPPPPEVIPPEQGGTPGGGIGGGLIVGGVEPQTSYLMMWGAIYCYDEQRGTDGEDPRNVMFVREDFHDGTQAGASYQTFLDQPFRVNAGWASEPSITIPQPDFNDPRFLRYESKGDGYGCFAYFSADHDEWENEQYKQTFLTGWNKVPEDVFYYMVNWDNTSDQCIGLGGDWLSEGNYEGYRCCGDDWIWVYNKPLDYIPRSIPDRNQLADNNELCLYTDTPNYGNPIDGAQYNMGDMSYFCDYQGMGHIAYDESLGYDNVPTEKTFPEAGDPYHFLGSGATETDLGKWSDRNESNPMLCTIDFSNAAGGGINFEWLDAVTAANSEQLYCEVFLGYNWTGTTCCGDDTTESYNDDATECNALNRAFQLLSTNIKPSSLRFKQEFETLCNTYQTENRACFEGKSIGNNTVGGNGSLFNTNGQLYVCSGNNIAGFDTAGKCEVRGSFETAAVCSYINDEWHVKTDTYSYDILGYRSRVFDNLADLSASVHDSSLPGSVQSLYDNDQECCFNNACWDGEKCVDSFMAYEYMGTWQEYDGVHDDNKEIYMCRDGGWLGPLDPIYDWHDNTQEPWFCIDEFQCYCDNEDCTSDDLDNGCTNVEDYYTGDHLCEESDWTSRTKVLATQMMEIGGSDYTLFCDYYDRSINYPIPIEPASANINSICVLESGDEVLLGVSFNAEDAMNLDSQSALLNSGNGFINIVLGESLHNCDYAINNADTSSHGNFKKCVNDNQKFWYNEKLKMLIYSQDGLSYGETLPVNYNTHNTELENLLNDISSHISSNSGAIEDDGIINIEVLSQANHFSRIYLGKSSGDTIFGLVETIYDPDMQEDRNFLGVVYKNVDGIDCTSVDSANRDAYCSDTGNDLFVLERRVDTDFPYWTDLTAKLRFK